ncbi:hypothetical protein [Nonomuraea jabiensis]|uniref:hypothetical protein n=1 Tax=Nonomuraea jabiensis TaxID=882448 RepID=UPI003D759370
MPPEWTPRLAERAVLADAAPAPQGRVPVTVVHGGPDSDEDMRLIDDVLPALAEKTGPPALPPGRQ